MITNKYKKKILAIAVSLTCVATPALSWAYGCCGPTLQAIAKSQAAITTKISMAQTEIARAVYSSGSDIEKAIGKAASLQSKTITQVQGEIASAKAKEDKLQKIAMAKVKAGQRYQLPPSDCTSLESSSKIVGTREIQRKASSKLSAGLAYRNMSIKTPKQAVWQTYNTHINDYCGSATAQVLGCEPTAMPDADINIGSVVDGAGQPGKVTDYTFTVDQESAAKAYIKNVTDPIPAKKITAKEAKTPAGQTFMVNQFAEAAKMSLASKPFVDALAWRQPVAGLGTQIQKIWQQADELGIRVPAGFTDQFKGKTAASPLAFLRTEVDRRAGNSQWYLDMTKASPEARLTESVYMQALGLQLKMNELMRLEKIEMLLGGIYAQAIKDSSNKNAEQR